MKSSQDITNEIMDMIETYSMAGITTEVLEVRIKNLLLVWGTECRRIGWTEEQNLTKSSCLRSRESKSL